MPAEKPLALASALLAAGTPWIQLRCKQIGADQQLALACELVARAKLHGAGVIVNDRLDVALASDAAGVHLGQEDLPIEVARRLAGSRKLIIGVSTHGVQEARQAAEHGADYIGFGPMFPTQSKQNALSPRSLALLREVRASVEIPIIAIGGIEERTATSVLDAGADGVAMIRALAESPAPADLARRLLG